MICYKFLLLENDYAKSPYLINVRKYQKINFNNKSNTRFYLKEFEIQKIQLRKSVYGHF